MSKKFLVFISTEKGLFKGRLNGASTIEGIEAAGLRNYGRVWPVVLDHKKDGRVYAGTWRGGMWRSEDAGKTWKEINEGLFYKEVWSIVQHPKTGTLFAGTGPASVFKSVDGGDNWANCEHLHTLEEGVDWTFPKPPYISHVKTLSLLEADPNLILGAIEEGWLIKSVDEGKTWKNLKNGTEFDSHMVIAMPDNPEILVSTSGTGCYRSVNGGESFTPSNEGMTTPYMAQLVQHMSEPSVLFTAGAEVPPPFWRRPEGANTRLYRSDDQGQSWKALNGGLPNHISAAVRSTAGLPGQPGSFMAGLSDGTIWLSKDHGERFSRIAEGLPPVFGLTAVPV